MSHSSVRDLSAALDGLLIGEPLEQLEAHLASCLACRSRRERLARHDDALRRLLAHDPDDRALDELARRSEALVVAIVRDQPVPRVTTSVPLEDAPKPMEPGTVERFGRFESGRLDSATHPTVDPTTYETHRSEAMSRPEDELPPARDPSRAMQRPDTDDSSRWTPERETPRAAEPGWESTAPRDGKQGHRTIADGYDAFNDLGYAGPHAARTPPSLPKSDGARKADAPGDTPRREYRHGGVRREAPEERAKPAPEKPERARKARADEGFGVKRSGGPAWARLGLEPDPFAPGQFREPLTGAVVEPPLVHARPARMPAQGPAPRKGRAMFVTLVVLGGVVALGFVLRASLPMLYPGSHFDPRVPAVETARREAEAAPPAPTPNPELDVRDATTRPPVESTVPPATTTTPGAAPSVCGMVLDASARPIPGALLLVAGNTDPVRSGADGRFCLSAPAGTHFVDIVDPRSPGARAKRVPLDFEAGAPEFRVQLP